MIRSVSRLLLPAACLLLVLAALPALYRPALSDEIYSLDAAALPWPALPAFLRADVHPPLYYILLKAWLAPFGYSLPALRAFSLACALLALVLLDRLARRWSPAGHAPAALLLAANALFVLLSSYGRMYTLLVLVCILAWLGADRALSGAGFHGASVSMAACTAAGLLTHHYFPFFLAALSLWAVLRAGAAAWRLVLPAALGLLLYAALWGPAAIEQFTARAAHLAWIKPPGPAGLSDALVAHLCLLVLALPAGLAALALRGQTPGRVWTPAHTAAALAAAASFALPWLVSFWKPVYNPRFTIIAAPFLAIALLPVAARTGPAWPAAAAGAAALWIWWPPPPGACTSAAAARILATQAAPADTVLFCRLTRKPVEYHWPQPVPRRQSFPAAIDSHPGYEGRLPPAAIEQEAAALARSIHARVFVLADTTSPASQALLAALARAGFRARPPLLGSGSPSKYYFNRLLLFDPPAPPQQAPSAAPPG